MNDLSINSLLAQRQTRLLGECGNHTDALKRLDISKLFATHFDGFDVVRTHLIHPGQFHAIRYPSNQVNAVLALLKDLGWIKSLKEQGKFGFSDDLGVDIRWYIQGGWLEEYVYCAQLDAGVDEAIYGQKVEWQVGDITGKNEIDVIARRGDVLSFTSCKTLHPEPKLGNTKVLTNFLTETSYWDTHFADNKGRALLVVTADFIDEINNDQHRYPTVLARASVLSVGAVGLEDLRWEKLVSKVDAHWNK